jgi:hypothetical protein
MIQHDGGAFNSKICRPLTSNLAQIAAKRLNNASGRSLRHFAPSQLSLCPPERLGGPTRANNAIFDDESGCGPGVVDYLAGIRPHSLFLGFEGSMQAAELSFTLPTAVPTS